ncbi:sugar transferase [Petrimonas mucosa]|uniref:sugar transferase n=1 Tax=Petrimonas mucosa TaxID=1642646 RepID=UPI0023F006AF|nr:sugar transferase [Petrimonas mucosa]MDD3561593.1 sugar transferase [Petrimonas mucosa]
MNPPIFFIGSDQQLAHHFVGILREAVSESPRVFSRYVDAARWLIDNSLDDDPVVFCEQQSLQEDEAGIKFLRRNFPHAYILLITAGLPGAERLDYIRAGVNDTVSPEANAELLSHFFQFIRKYRPHLQSRRQRDTTLLPQFKMPVTKRAFDVVVSICALLFLSPLFLLVALAIRLESKGPIFYKSRRVGTNYHIFDFWKFRSMYVDADKRLKEVEQYDQYATTTPTEEQQLPIDDGLDLEQLESLGQTFLVDDDFILPEEEYIAQNRQKTERAFVKIEKDPRVTRVGQFIRKYSIDELPQLINILKGEMSFVGNRPLPLYEAELLTGDNSVERFIAPAGLTGLWQVQKRGDAGKLSAEERKQLDIYYAQHYTIWLDLKIIFRTFAAFIQKEDV